MSLYNMLHGMNANSNLLLSFLGLTRSDVGRFRDCYVAEHNGEDVIAVYTRNGGGNRDHWDSSGAEDEETEEECVCPGCIITNILPEHPLYIYDCDDDFDNTYATIYFKVPEFAKEIVSALKDNSPTPAEKMKIMFESLSKGDENDPVFIKAMEVGKPILDQIAKAFDSGESGIITV